MCEFLGSSTFRLGCAIKCWRILCCTIYNVFFDNISSAVVLHGRIPLPFLLSLRIQYRLHPDTTSALLAVKRFVVLFHMLCISCIGRSDLRYFRYENPPRLLYRRLCAISRSPLSQLQIEFIHGAAVIVIELVPRSISSWVVIDTRP